MHAPLMRPGAVDLPILVQDARAEVDACVHGQGAELLPTSTPPMRRATSTCCEPPWATASSPTTASRTAAPWARPTPRCSPGTCARWSSTRLSTRTPT